MFSLPTPIYDASMARLKEDIAELEKIAQAIAIAPGDINNVFIAIRKNLVDYRFAEEGYQNCRKVFLECIPALYPSILTDKYVQEADAIFSLDKRDLLIWLTTIFRSINYQESVNADVSTDYLHLLHDFIDDIYEIYNARWTASSPEEHSNINQEMESFLNFASVFLSHFESFNRQEGGSTRFMPILTPMEEIRKQFAEYIPPENIAASGQSALLRLEHTMPYRPAKADIS
ncbi:MAG: hypothetical protein ABW189_00060 [Rickettsiales bacterium]